MVRPSVPVDGPAPLGELPSPVSVGTMTLFRADGAGGGKPASAATGAAARGGGALDEAEPHAGASKARATKYTRRTEHEVIREI